MFKDGSRFISGSAILFYLQKLADILLCMEKDRFLIASE
ncbi:hypothetical protein LEP1GSC186_4527 [Leptospira noguchii serovar Autumnalis str. ZUN142]|uniref:Uncharacterized protein n=1 Tax=Leptospira noguchii serovar Autumnalis str. ZUN142 TaxID=1085540 RepID=M6UMQ7_9LEPT|nr:hypothetical protein LEP1GSC186_4527 [Leptospira noguchii serovar Autumnalis str. ZUN142]